MQIVVLDGLTLNPGDLSWAPLRAIGSCTIYERTTEAEALQRIWDADIVLTNKVPLRRKTILGALPLRYVGVLATGYDVVDAETARERGIPVTNVPAYSTMSVAQLVFAHLLNLTHNVGHHAQAVRNSRWASSPDFSFWDFPLVELQGQLLGIIGFGHIGRSVALIGKSFGMEVLVHTRSQIREPGYTPASLDAIFSQSDVVSLNCPLTEETRGLVNRTRLSLMKRTAYLINTSRGPLIDEQALAEALRGGQLAGAGLDVLSVEPPPPDHPLLGAPHCFITPHIAWATTAARQRLLREAVENIRAFLQGKKRNVVNGI
jgi:glycerate dehydrogenase